ncbi:hypothetical protein SAMN05216421_2098 [Halopseudomonas xinjiangensis]|uniref:Uncharacterized protein n=1 Tax=Halopseudomonas xinjiangensis TaxID=487184 RepID=A0A1H1UNK5_9GAMM|nr:hypothetical protein SAMN05216421_2098 [Halopseudomonas xinjiangensis]
MLVTLTVIAMVVLAGYLWHSAGELRHRSVRPHGENDVTSAGAVLLMRSTCIAMLTLAIAFLATSWQPAPGTSIDPTDLDAHSAAVEPSVTPE